MKRKIKLTKPVNEKSLVQQNKREKDEGDEQLNKTLRQPDEHQTTVLK
jgi:hypothetical protein